MTARTHDAAGRQLVIVRGYTFAWRGVPLALGDEVELPANYIQPHGWNGVVTALGSDYDGPVKEVRYVRQRAS